jgi:hypothetical protein
LESHYVLSFREVSMIFKRAIAKLRAQGWVPIMIELAT